MTYNGCACTHFETFWQKKKYLIKARVFWIGHGDSKSLDLRPLMPTLLSVKVALLPNPKNKDNTPWGKESINHWLENCCTSLNQNSTVHPNDHDLHDQLWWLLCQGVRLCLAWFLLPLVFQYTNLVMLSLESRLDDGYC